MTQKSSNTSDSNRFQHKSHEFHEHVSSLQTLCANPYISFTFQYVGAYSGIIEA